MTERTRKFRTAFDRLIDDRTQFDAPFTKLQLVARNAADVDQIVDEPRQLPQLTLQNAACSACDGRVVTGPIEQFERIHHRRERTAQLVGQRREERVLVTIRIAQRLLGGRALDDVRRHAGKQIDVAKFALARSVRCREMVAQTTEQPALAIDERGRLDRANAFATQPRDFGHAGQRRRQSVDVVDDQPFERRCWLDAAA